MRGRPNHGRHPNFKGGTTKAQHGYILVFVGKHHHLSDIRGYAYQHRIVAEDMLGRRLLKTEFVHHKDGNKANNAPDNLEVFPSHAHHYVEHRKVNFGKKLPDEANVMITCACGCGQQMLKYDTSNRPRKFIHRHNGRKMAGTFADSAVSGVQSLNIEN